MLKASAARWIGTVLGPSSRFVVLVRRGTDPWVLKAGGLVEGHPMAWCRMVARCLQVRLGVCRRRGSWLQVRLGVCRGGVLAACRLGVCRRVLAAGKAKSLQRARPCLQGWGASRPGCHSWNSLWMRSWETRGRRLDLGVCVAPVLLRSCRPLRTPGPRRGWSRA